MSKNINVNPDHYKVAGRERPGHAIAKEQTIRKDDVQARERWEERQKEKSRKQK